jgi:hypothetical protein
MYEDDTPAVKKGSRTMDHPVETANVLDRRGTLQVIHSISNSTVELAATFTMAKMYQQGIPLYRNGHEHCCARGIALSTIGMKNAAGLQVPSWTTPRLWRMSYLCLFCSMRINPSVDSHCVGLMRVAGDRRGLCRRESQANSWDGRRKLLFGAIIAFVSFPHLTGGKYL